MKKINIGKYICFGGILTTFAVLFQSAPVFLPAIGLALSPFSTLPIALAAIFNISLGFCVLFSSAFLLILVSAEEAMILLFTTGLLGIVIGTLLYRKGALSSILCSSIALSLGMVCLTYVVSMTAFVEFTNSRSTPFIFLIFFLFSLVYASIWTICLRKFVNYLKKIELIS